MEEIEQLILLINKLPTLAIWVLVGFFAYKTIVIGSIYGTIKLAIIKTHDWLVYKKGIHTVTVKELSNCNVSSSDIIYLNQIFSKLKTGEYHPLADSRMRAVITFLEKEYPK